MIPQSLEETFKEQNEKESLNESNTKLCSCCEDNFVAAYYCQECEDDICESCYQAHKIVKVTQNHTITVLKVIPSDFNESAIKICTGCSKDSLASYKCEECSDYICEECFKAHKIVKFTRNHNLIPLAM